MRENAMMTELLDSIRAACAEVAGEARHVRLVEERIPAYAASLGAIAETPALDPEHHYLGHGEATLAFVITLDSINFGSGYFPHLQKIPGHSGYFTVATRLTERFAEAGPLAPSDLARLSPGACAEIFRQDAGDPARAELMALFARALNDLGIWLIRRFEGSFADMVGAAGGRAETLVGLLSEMQFFRDVELYAGREVPFYKRAQITAADLALAFGGEGWGRFEDLRRLTIFADNLVPHVLHVDGLLEYEPALRAAILAGELIPAGSEEEIEIRAVALHAVELLAAACRERGTEVVPMELDFLLWNRGQQPEYKAIPRHRTQTVFY